MIAYCRGGLHMYARSVRRLALCASLALVSMAFAPSAALPETPQQRLTTNVTPDPAAAVFVVDDLQRFVAATDRIAAGEDAAMVLQRDYLDLASSGLKIYIEKYDLTAERLVSAMQLHPDKYAAIDATIDALNSQRDAFRQIYAEIKQIMPDSVFPPTYFVVAGHRGIGSGSIEGPLISIEKDTPESIRTDLAATLVHEMVHMQQLAALAEAYFVIFNGPERTLLALCIREGVATYFSEIITGGSVHKNAARDFLLAHEEELWSAFEREMLGGETGDWLWSEPENPEQPQDVGYAMGARIAEYYYENADDKPRVVRELLGVTDYPELLKRSGYKAN